MVLVLSVLSRALVVASSQQGYNSLNYVGEKKATLLAESANLLVIDELSRDDSFSDDIRDGRLESMEGVYQVDFVAPSDSEVGWNQSVNNLNGSVAVDGPRGKNTVPPGALNLVVVVQVQGIEKRFETLIRRPVFGGILPAIGSSGKITLQGDVTVDGIESVSAETEIDGDIHSSFSASTSTPVISWSGSSGEQAKISGKVAVSSPSASAISMGSASIDGGTETSFAIPPAPEPQIVNTVLSKSGASPFSAPVFGDVNAGSGEYYSAGGVSVDGDLVLNGTDLYIDGDLRVNGSIRGQGTVWVTGNTQFRGDSSIRVGSEDSVSLLSHGNVSLQGFSGLEYLEAFVQSAGDPALVKAFEDTKGALNAIQQIAENRSAAEFNRELAADQETTPWRRVLGDPPTPRVKLEQPPPGYEINSLGRLKDGLAAAAENDKGTKAFMLERLDILRRANMESIDAGGDDPATVRQAVAEWERGDLSGAGYWDYIVEYEFRTGEPLPEGTLEELANFASQLSLDRLGTSSFQGTVFTDGAFLAEHEVNVIGQIQATGRNESAGDLTSASGQTVEPGDVFVGDGCHVTYCREYSDDAKEAMSSGSEFEVSVWLGDRTERAE